MQILVRDAPTTYRMDGNGVFRCGHDKAVVEPPCCTGELCACKGVYQVYCPDCRNADVTEEDVEEILGSYDG